MSQSDHLNSGESQLYSSTHFLCYFNPLGNLSLLLSLWCLWSKDTISKPIQWRLRGPFHSQTIFGKFIKFHFDLMAFEMRSEIPNADGYFVIWRPLLYQLHSTHWATLQTSATVPLIIAVTRSVLVHNGEYVLKRERERLKWITFWITSCVCTKEQMINNKDIYFWRYYFRKYWHTSATWGWSLSSTRMNSGPSAPACGFRLSLVSHPGTSV